LYATAAELSRFWSDVVWADTDESFPVDKLVFVASGTVFADALSGGALAGVYGGPILLTRPGSLPKATAQALARLDPDHIVVLGGRPGGRPAAAAARRAAPGGAPAGPRPRRAGARRAPPAPPAPPAAPRDALEAGGGPAPPRAGAGAGRPQAGGLGGRQAHRA